MRVKDVPGWSHREFKGGKLLDTSHIKCPVCLGVSPLADWEAAEAFYDHVAQLDRAPGFQPGLGWGFDSPRGLCALHLFHPPKVRHPCCECRDP